MSLVKLGTEPVRHLKIGSVIVREYEGKLHEVMVASGGFYWSRPVDHRPQDHRNQLERTPLLWPARKGQAATG
jgi:hypothetical protein